MYKFPSYLFLILSLSLTLNTYIIYRKLKHEYKKSKKYKRSNCVVMYSRGSMSGWPPNTQKVKCGIGKLDLLFEPIVYFIDVTEKTLDIAVMIITVEKYREALTEAKKRGVSIRIISQLEKNSAIFNKLKKIGVSITLFVPTEERFPKLFHYKYMVRDFGTSNQCVCLGSMNYTVSGATDNYENIVFTQVPHVVENTYTNFESCLKLITEDNKSLYKSSVLEHANIF